MNASMAEAEPIPIQDDDGCSSEIEDNDFQTLCSDSNTTYDYGDHGDGDGEEEEGFGEFDETDPTLFQMTGVDTSLGGLDLEDALSKILSIPVTLLESDYNGEEGTILFCCSSFQNNTHDNDDRVLEKISGYLSKATAKITTCTSRFLLQDSASLASIAILDMDEGDENDDCVEYITEEEAYQMWLKHNNPNNNSSSGNSSSSSSIDGNTINGDGNNCDTRDANYSDLVSSPDGTLVLPQHRHQETHESPTSTMQMQTQMQMQTPTPTAQQLERDPGLFDFDNVVRVHYTEVLDYLSDIETKTKNGNGNGNSSSNKNDSPPSSSASSWKDGFGSQPIVFYGLGHNDQHKNENENETGEEDDSKHTNPKDIHNNNTNPHQEAADLISFQKALRETIRLHGSDTIVRTGNRETLVKNGFHNSKPATLAETVSRTLLQLPEAEEEAESEAKSEIAMTEVSHCVGNGSETDAPMDMDGTIVFNPIHEMPPEFHGDDVLGRYINANANANTSETSATEESHQRVFPNRLWHRILAPHCNKDDDNDNDKDDDYDHYSDSPRFTLCIANEGFGIGMHNHGPALFFLTEGRKKWYMNHPEPIDDRIARAAVAANGGNCEESDTGNTNTNTNTNNNTTTTTTTSPTHPGFYRELSSHKCVQEPGELLFVPNQWYHEIYNLASPTIGIQALVWREIWPTSSLSQV